MGTNAGAKHFNKEEIGWVKNFSRARASILDTRRMSKFAGIENLKPSTYESR